MNENPRFAQVAYEAHQFASLIRAMESSDDHLDIWLETEPMSFVVAAPAVPKRVAGAY